MTVTEYQRQQLLNWFEENMGPDLASTMMELTPPTGWGELATKRDLDTLGSELRGEMAELRGEMGALAGELRGEMGDLRGEMGDLRGEMHAIASGYFRSFAALLFASQAATVAIITVVVSLAG